MILYGIQPKPKTWRSNDYRLEVHTRMDGALRPLGSVYKDFDPIFQIYVGTPEYHVEAKDMVNWLNSEKPVKKFLEDLERNLVQDCKVNGNGYFMPYVEMVREIRQKLETPDD